MAIIAREEREKKEADAARLAKEAKKKALKAKLDGDKNMDMGALEQELADGDGGFRGDLEEDDNFEWDGGRGDGGLAPLPQAGPSKALSIDPTTSEEAAVVLERILKQFQNKKSHLTLLKGLIKSATQEMSTEDTKDLSSHVSVIFNDKLKADRDKDKKKPKAKAGKKFNVSAGKAVDGDDGYDDYY